MTQEKQISGPKTVNIPVAAMTGATADSEQVLYQALVNLTVLAVSWIPSANVTANGTNFSTLTVRNRKGDASGSALPASRSYAAVNSTAFVPETMTLSGTATDLQLAAGDVLTAQMIHSGTGVVIPAGMVRLTVQGR